MSTSRADHFRLGLFVLVGSAVLVVGLYLLGSKRNLFQPVVRISATFEQVGGLRPGNNVRYMGINVGTVERITLLSDTGVEVRLAIKEKHAQHIRDNAVASIGSDGLMGNRLVNLAPGGPGGTPVTDGVHLSTSVPLDTDLMLRTLDRTNDNLAAITDDVRLLAHKLNKEGSVIDLLTDTVLSDDLRQAMHDLQQAAAHARSATAGVDAVLADVQAGKGALGTLVSDPTAEGQVRAWLTTMQSLADSLATVTMRIDQFANGLNEPGGLGYTVTKDTAVARDVRLTLSQLQRSSVTLEENLRALRSNWFFRGYFKEQEKRDRKAKQLDHDGRTR